MVHRDFGRSCPDRANKVLAHLTHASRSDAIVFLPNPKRPLRLGQQIPVGPLDVNTDLTTIVAPSDEAWTGIGLFLLYMTAC